MNPDPATHVSIDRCDLSDAAFWLGQLTRWLDDPNHASQFSWDLFNVPEDYQPPLTVVIAGITKPLTTALQVGPKQTDTPGQMKLTQASGPLPAVNGSLPAVNGRSMAAPPGD